MISNLLWRALGVPVFLYLLAHHVRHNLKPIFFRPVRNSDRQEQE